jgi:hypothetical protein
MSYEIPGFQEYYVFSDIGAMIPDSLQGFGPDEFSQRDSRKLTQYNHVGALPPDITHLFIFQKFR